MTDVHTREQRRRNMQAIKGTDTKPERHVRSLLHRMGYRFRLHRKDLPGRPDIVLPRYRAVIFVHGCYWHLHDCPYGRVVPKTRTDFWQRKRRRNAERDRENEEQLEDAGWRVIVVWECETRPADVEKLRSRLQRCLSEYDTDKI